MTQRVLPENRHDKAPKLPTDRPPTRRECWEHYHAVYFDFKGHKPTPACTPQCNHRNEGELEAFARDAWVWAYIERCMHKSWDKQPDWTEDDPVIPEAVLDTSAQPLSGNWRQCLEVTYQLLETAKQLSERRVAA